MPWPGRAEDIELAFEAPKGRADALYVVADPLMTTNQIHIKGSHGFDEQIVCRQSISGSWPGNLRECLAHLV